MPVAANGDQSGLYHRFVATWAQRSALDGVRIPALSQGRPICALLKRSHLLCLYYLARKTTSALQWRTWIRPGHLFPPRPADVVMQWDVGAPQAQPHRPRSGRRSGLEVARLCSKVVPADGTNAAAKAVGDWVVSLMTSVGQKIWPHHRGFDPYRSGPPRRRRSVPKRTLQAFESFPGLLGRHAV